MDTDADGSSPLCSRTTPRPPTRSTLWPLPHQSALRGLNLKEVRVCARFRPSGESSVSYAKQALRRQSSLRQVANRSRRQPRAHEIGTILCRAVWCPVRHRPGRQPASQQALWRIATTRMRTDASTKEYVTKRQGRNLPADHQPATHPDCAKLRQTTPAASALELGDTRTAPNPPPGPTNADLTTIGAS